MAKFKFGNFESIFGSMNFKFGFSARFGIIGYVCNALIYNKKVSDSVRHLKLSLSFKGGN